MPQPCVPNISDDRPCATGGYGGEFGLGLLNTDGGWLVEDVFFLRGFASKSRKLFGPTINGFIFNLGVNHFDGQIESDSWVTQDWEGIFLILGQKMAEAVEHMARLL